MSITLENKQCLIAGDGLLPVKMAQGARENGFEVVAISLSSDNFKELQKYCSKVISLGFEQVETMEKFLKEQKLNNNIFLLPNVTYKPSVGPIKKNDQKLHLLFIGAIDSRKGIFDVLECFAKNKEILQNK